VRIDGIQGEGEWRIFGENFDFMPELKRIGKQIISKQSQKC
jgi:hypothetical protein